MNKIYRTYLAHYNHNHDKLGRFARSVGGSSDFILAKDYKVKRVGKRKEKADAHHRTYVSTTDADDKIYTAMSRTVFGATHKYVYKTKKDSKIAGTNIQKKVFNELVKDFKIKDFTDHVNYIDTQINPDLKNVKTKKEISKLYKNINSKKDYQKAYDAFICNINNSKSKLSSEFFDRLAKRGYDGLVDDYDSHDPNSPGLQFLSNGNVNIKAQRAVIFLDRGENLERISRKRISKRQRLKALEYLRDSGLMDEKIIMLDSDGGEDIVDDKKLKDLI